MKHLGFFIQAAATAAIIMGYGYYHYCYHYEVLFIH